LGWGGDPGVEWAQKIVDGLEESTKTPGAGEEGTDELLKNYLKDTPHAKIVNSPHNVMMSFRDFYDEMCDKERNVKET
jgi:hypothetical protein